MFSKQITWLQRRIREERKYFKMQAFVTESVPLIFIIVKQVKYS